MTPNTLSEIHNSHKEKSLFGRYITNQNIEKILEKFSSKIYKSVIGYSVENRPIHSVKIGSGKTKILAWSQMHGNESTTTKALFDFFNTIKNSDVFNDILNKCTLQIIPILNPDGAKRYTRLNANEIDLNRDAQDLSQPESQILRRVFDEFQPGYCLNLHGQRTIFGAGTAGNSSTLSFLSPAEDEKRTVTDARKKGMAVIYYINKMMQQDLPNAIGRYDDGFNINCVGDTFQFLKVPTVLFEAGHYKDDYDREFTREFIFKSFIYALKAIANGVEATDYKGYFDIPENEKSFFDIIIRNARVNESEDTTDIAIQFKEVLKDKSIHFIPIVEKIENLDFYFAHKVIDAKHEIVLDQNSKPLKVANEIDFAIINDRKTLIKS